MKPFFVSTDFLCPHLSWVLLYFTFFLILPDYKPFKVKAHISFSVSFPTSLGFPGDSDSKESACNEGDLGSIPGQEDPLEKAMAIHSVFLPGEICRQRSLVGYSAWSCKESDTTEQLMLLLSQYLAKYIVKTKHYLLYECFPITFSGTIVWTL